VLRVRQRRLKRSWQHAAAGARAAPAPRRLTVIFRLPSSPRHEAAESLTRLLNTALIRRIRTRHTPLIDASFLSSSPSSSFSPSLFFPAASRTDAHSSCRPSAYLMLTFLCHSSPPAVHAALPPASPIAPDAGIRYSDNDI